MPRDEGHDTVGSHFGRGAVGFFQPATLVGKTLDPKDYRGRHHCREEQQHTSDADTHREFESCNNHRPLSKRALRNPYNLSQVRYCLPQH